MNTCNKMDLFNHSCVESNHSKLITPAVGFNTIDEAIADLKKGKVIIVCDDENRENEGDFIALADNITAEIINFMITHGKGLLCMPINQEIAQRINLDLMVANNTDNFNTAFTVSVDHISTGTGISAESRAVTIQKIIDSSVPAAEFRKPGHIFPLIAKENGVLERNGHTEAAVDLAKLCGATPAGVICEIINVDGTMARVPQLQQMARDFNLKIITIKDLTYYIKKTKHLIKLEAVAKLPTNYGEFNIYAYSNILDNKEHIAIIKGDPLQFTADKIPLVRIHSECLTGDVFASRRCDCGEQLDKSFQIIEQAGYGMVIYLRQEGRGIGIINKIKAYELQQQGLDTVDANKELGLAVDMREYAIAAKILLSLNITKIRLITNNPQKIDELNFYGIEVSERINVKTAKVAENEKYLQTKKERLGHLL
ncbi:MAG: bifunctional 3,4-dihydroxy-2-butanone-4-phosphate synthase/GTP cyclohydrolase II [Burkholderiales bacterium]|nr:bifunctional 3,4-dihydroxy-2-butanone-4-phosphate synthase/GTP cyclohydrolase II [Burkholderiales bacterium]